MHYRGGDNDDNDGVTGDVDGMMLLIMVIIVMNNNNDDNEIVDNGGDNDFQYVIADDGHGVVNVYELNGE